MTPTIALVPSPLLGASCWRAVRDVLEGGGRACRIVDLSGALHVERDVYTALGEAAADQLGGPAILVVHSGAGGLTPSIANAAGRNLLGVVFVDALPPHPGRSWFETAPPALAERLGKAARGGRVPPWPQWLPETALAALLPDPAMRQSLIDDAPAAPLAFLQATAPTEQAAAPPRHCAYLQLSPGYAAEADQAEAMGWVVERMAGRHHLSMMTEPDAVGAAIVRLSEGLNTIR